MSEPRDTIDRTAALDRISHRLGPPERQDPEMLELLLEHLGGHPPTLEAAAALLDVLGPRDLVDMLDKRGLAALSSKELLEETRTEFASLSAQARKVLRHFGACHAFSSSELEPSHEASALIELVDRNWIASDNTDAPRTTFRVPLWTRNVVRHVSDDWDEALSRQNHLVAKRHVAPDHANRTGALLNARYGFEDSVAVASDDRATCEDRLLAGALAIRLSLLAKDRDAAAQMARRLESLLEAKSGDPIVRGMAAFDLAYYFYMNGPLHRATSVARRAANALEYDSTLRFALEIEAVRFAWRDEEIDDALEQLEHLEARAMEVRPAAWAAMRMHHIRSIIETWHGRYSKACESIGIASALALDAGDSEYHWLYEISYGFYLRALGRVDKALEIFERERPRMRSIGRPDWIPPVLADLARLYVLSGDRARARETSAAALEAAREVDSPLALGLASCVHARTVFNLGRLNEALKAFTEARHLYQSRDSVETFARFGGGVFAAVTLELGMRDEALEILEESKTGDVTDTLLIWSEVMILTRIGKETEALVAVEELLDMVSWEDDLDVRTLGLALQALLFTRLERTSEAREVTRDALEVLKSMACPVTTSTSLLHVVDRIAHGDTPEGALEAAPRPFRAPANTDLTLLSWELRWLHDSYATDPRGPIVWTIDQSGRWFTSGANDRVELAGRATLARILAALIEARSRDLQGLSVDELAEAGWPGEFIEQKARRNRVYVAVRTLRKLGLEGLLLRGDSGYLLDPEQRIRVL